MADANLPTLYTANPVSIDPGDISYVVENTGTTPAHGAYKLSQLMFNRYKISVTVSANDLVVALKHEDGTDPSADRPLYFKIGDSLRACTAALSKTLADGTNWFASGSAELATKEIDYFVYAIWNTTGTDILDLGFARVPYFSVYSDASATTTNERYLAYANASAPAATDDMVNIGRFAATLSAGAGYTWTVPTFTTINLVNRPIFETRRLLYTSALTWTAGAAPTGGTGLVYSYHLEGHKCFVKGQGYNMTAGATVTKLVATIPFLPSIAAASGGVQLIPSHIGVGAAQNLTMGEINFAAQSLTINCASNSATMFLWQGYYYI